MQADRVGVATAKRARASTSRLRRRTMRPRRSPDPWRHHPLERVWCSIRSGLLLRWIELHIRRLSSSLGPRPTTPVSMLTRSEASRLLIRHPPSVEHLGRLPAAPLFLPPQPAHGPPHGGDGDPLPLLDLPHLAVALQARTVVLRELPPQGAALLGGGDERPTSGGTRGAYLSG